MGIYDRDYFRNEGPSFLDSLLPTGLVCRWLIAINVGIFFLQLVAYTPAHAHDIGMRANSDGWVTDWLMLDTDAVMHGQIWRLLSYSFVHAPDSPYFSHLLFNMLFLWWFGSDVEQLYGRKEFLAIYLLSALCGGVAFQLWSLLRGEPGRCIGASGAVTTMLVLCAFHYPRRIIYLFMFLPVPIWLFAVFNVVQDTFVLVGRHKTNVAVIVHLAGAAFAVGYFKWQGSLTGTFLSLMFWQRIRPRPRLKIFDPEPIEKEEPVAVTAITSAIVMDEHLEAKLDAVLEKIARTGKESLTEQERRILQQAAEMYKRRRT